MKNEELDRLNQELKSLRRKLKEDSRKRKQAEKALKESEARLRHLMENSADAFFLHDLNGKILDVNAQACKSLGYTREELLRLNIKDIEVEFLTGKHANHWRQAIPATPITLEGVQKRKDGTAFPVEVRLMGFEVDGQKLMLATVRDITNRKRIEKALQEREERFRELFNNMSSGVAIYEAKKKGGDFVFKDVNRAVERIEKATREELLGRSVLEVFPGIKEFGLFDVFKRVWKTGKAERHPASFYKDSRIEGWRENYVYKLPSGEIVAVYDDVTEKKFAEQMLQDSEEKYRTIIESIEDGYFEVDLAGNFSFFNDSMCRITGYSRDELMGMNYRLCTHKESSRGIFSSFKRVYETGVPERNLDWQMITKDGEKRDIELSLFHLSGTGVAKQ